MKGSDITVITPTIIGRESMLAEAEASVLVQTVKPAAHLTCIDTYRNGPAIVRNLLLGRVETEWVAFLDDDDLLDRHHLDILSSGHTDVRASFCRFSGEELPAKYVNRHYDREAMRRHGIFGITVMARLEAIRDAGCFGVERYEDWSLWNRMADNGATFEVIPIITWTYRLGHGNRTHQ